MVKKGAAEKSALAAKLKAEKKIKKQKVKQSAPPAAPAVQGQAETPKKAKKAKKQKTPEQIAAATARRAATKANKQLKKEKKAQKKLAKAAKSKTPAGVKKNKDKYNNKPAAEKRKRKRERLAAVAQAKAASAAQESLPSPAKCKNQESKQHQIAAAEGTAAALQADAEPAGEADASKQGKKKKKKAAVSDSDVAATVVSAEPLLDPAGLTQAVTVAMPEEAVKTLAGAIQDANGGTIHLVANDKASDVPRASGGGRAFQRVKAEEWVGKKGALDNSYQATFGADGWGAKAQQVLGQVRGKDFRHEKTKKKRGTYKGGQIDFKVNSFKYDSD